MVGMNVSLAHGVDRVAGLLDSPEVTRLIADLQRTRWTGQPGYPVRTMVGLALVKAVYALPTWTRAVRLVAEHDALRDTLGAAPSVSAAYRFAGKLRDNADALTTCLDRVLTEMRDYFAGFGDVVAIDGSDLPAYANGQRYLFNGGPERQHYSDAYASWGAPLRYFHPQGRRFYGYKVHAAVCTTTGLPVAWKVLSANAPELAELPILLDAARDRGFTPMVCVADKGYDGAPTYAACEARGIRPVIPLIESAGVKAGKHLPPSCEHGVWTFAGSDAKRGASKWRCPDRACTPGSVWLPADRLHTLIPRTTDRWKTLYKTRGAVEREFGVLKHQWAMLPMRVRGLDKVRLHVSLSTLAQLTSALTDARTRAVPLLA